MKKTLEGTGADNPKQENPFAFLKASGPVESYPVEVLESRIEEKRAKEEKK